jgi:hypothetical protein
VLNHVEPNLTPSTWRWISLFCAWGTLVWLGLHEAVYPKIRAWPLRTLLLAGLTAIIVSGSCTWWIMGPPLTHPGARTYAVLTAIPGDTSDSTFYFTVTNEGTTEATVWADIQVTSVSGFPMGMWDKGVDGGWARAETRELVLRPTQSDKLQIGTMRAGVLRFLYFDHGHQAVAQDPGGAPVLNLTIALRATPELAHPMIGKYTLTSNGLSPATAVWDTIP